MLGGENWKVAIFDTNSLGNWETIYAEFLVYITAILSGTGFVIF